MRLVPSLFLAGTATFAPAFAQVETNDLNVESSLLFAPNPIFLDGVSSHRTMDGRTFTLSRSGDTALFQFEGNKEVWHLNIVAAPRGDEFLKNDAGRIFVRLTDLGNVIQYDAKAPKGQPVEALDQPAFQITPPSAKTGFESDLQSYLSLRLQRSFSVSIEGEGNARAWTENAALVAGEALLRARKNATGVRSLVVRPDRIPEIEVDSSGRMIVYVDTDAGYAGHPSSDRVIRYLKTRLSH